jgi:hypothetical protein
MAGPLHERAQRRHIDAEQQRHTQHPFVPDQADLESLAVGSGRDQRDEAVDGKIDVANAFAGHVQRF